MDGAARVNLVLFQTGLLEVELGNLYHSRQHQPEVSWYAIIMLADLFAATTPEQRIGLTGSEELAVRLTTRSGGLDYTYRSQTDYATMVRLNKRSISYDEWVQIAGAGFE